MLRQDLANMESEGSGWDSFGIEPDRDGIRMGSGWDRLGSGWDRDGTDIDFFGFLNEIFLYFYPPRIELL